MDKHYIIRKKAYDYDNGLNYPEDCSYGVYAIHDNLEKAKNHRLSLEKETINGEGLRFVTMHENPIQSKLADFFESNFNRNIWENEKKQTIYNAMTVPEDCSLIQIKELMEIIGFSYFEIVEKDAELDFYTLSFHQEQWENTPCGLKHMPLNSFEGEHNHNSARFFNTEEEAKNNALFHILSEFQYFYKWNPDNHISNFVKNIVFDRYNYSFTFEKESEFEFMKDYTKDLYSINKEEMWDLLYQTQSAHISNIKIDHELHGMSLEQLSRLYGMPDFYIKMALSDEL